MPVHILPIVNKGQFTADLNKLAEKAGSNADKVIRKAVLSLFSDLVRTTPVDTGRLRANWQVGQDYSPVSILEETYSTQKVKSKYGPPIMKGFGRFDQKSKEGAPTVQRERPSIAALTVQKDGIVGYIYNNVRYGIYVEYGPPTPRGFVRAAVNKFNEWCVQAAQSVK